MGSLCGCAWASALVLAACGGAATPATRPSAGRQPKETPRSLAATFEYRATTDAKASELTVDLAVPAGTPSANWTVDPGMRAFVRDLTLDASSAGASSDEGWSLPACSAPPGCHIRYRVLLRDAANALDDHDRAQLSADAILSPPSAWLLRTDAAHARFRLKVEPSAGVSFVTGLAATDPQVGSYVGATDALDDTPYGAFGPFTPWRRSFGSSTVDVAFFPDHPTPAMKLWVDNALGAVERYFGRFPIEHAALLVRVDEGRGVDDGRTMGHGGGSVMIAAGKDTDALGFRNDWVLVHELIHVSFPEVGAAWAEEGIATYLEPIIRLRSRGCDRDEIWRSLYRGLPQGQPQAGDGGLDVTDTWGRRYWGGALFWFLADVEIRERTSNAKGLDDVMWAIRRAGGNVSVRWSLDRVLAMGDEAVGVPVLVPLRKRLGAAPGRADLDGTWRRLGVAETGGHMVYDDEAPLASVRHAIETGGQTRQTRQTRQAD